MNSKAVKNSLVCQSPREMRFVLNEVISSVHATFKRDFTRDALVTDGFGSRTGYGAPQPEKPGDVICLFVIVFTCFCNLYKYNHPW